MPEFPIKFYNYGQWSDASLPDWQGNENHPQWLERIGYYSDAVDQFGCGSDDSGVETYTKRDGSGATDDLPKHLVVVGVGSAYTCIGVADHLNLILLCRDLAPLAQLFLLQSVFDALFQDEAGWFQFQRLDALKDFIKTWIG